MILSSVPWKDASLALGDVKGECAICICQLRAQSKLWCSEISRWELLLPCEPQCTDMQIGKKSIIPKALHPTLHSN